MQVLPMQVGPFAFRYQGNRATPCQYIDTTRKAIDCTTTLPLTVVKPVWQPGKCLYTRYNRLYRVYKHSMGRQTHLTTGLTNGCIVYTAGCQTGCTTRFDNRLNEQWLLVQHGCSTGWMFVYTIQPVVSCKWGISRSSNNINSSSTLSQKNVPPLTCYNHDTHGSITIILGPNVTEKAGNQNALNFPTSPH